MTNQTTEGYNLINETGYIKKRGEGRMKNITISDIAQRAGVSKATVSRVLNSPEKVEEGTRKKIEQIMKAAQYTPSATARNLSKQASSTIGVIVPEIGNAFFGDLFMGIEEIINKNNLSLLYCSNEDKIQKDFEALDMMKTQRVKGVLYVPAMNYPVAGMLNKVQKKLESLGCPAVCIDRDIHLHMDTIHFNDRKAVKAAVQSLVKAGHQRIAFINGNEKKNILATERYEGYREGLMEAGIPEDEALVYQGEYQKSYAYLAMKDLMEKKSTFTAVITCNNSLGKGYLQAVHEADKADAYTHIGLDRIEMLDILRIPNNYILRDSYEMGKQAAELLISRIAFPEKKIQNILMDASLIRETF